METVTTHRAERPARLTATSRSWRCSSTTSSSSTRRPRIGMWLFLATEVMFFGGLITAYTVYRATSPREFALASQHLKRLAGLPEYRDSAGQQPLDGPGRPRRPAAPPPRSALGSWLITAALGACFLGIKAVEYYQEYREISIPGLELPGPANVMAEVHRTRPWTRARFEMFFVLYFFMTGLHAFHLIIGIALVGVMAYADVAAMAFRFGRDPDRGDRPLLAFRRHGVGLPLSASLFD